MKALVAFDGSEQALRALDWVAQAGVSHATVLTVGPSSEAREGRRRRGRGFSDRPGFALPEELEQAVEQLRRAGVSASSLEKQGRVDEAIVAAAESGAFDLIVVGSARRRGFLSRLFARSIPEQVLRSSPVSVLVVRADPGG